MRAKRNVRPSVDALEDRLNLSFSLSSVLHSVFPFIHDHNAKTTKSAHVGTVNPAKSGLSPQTVRLQHWAAAHPQAAQNSVALHPDGALAKAMQAGNV